MAKDDLNFTEALTRLEAIVKKVKSDDLPLDESLELLEEGVELANLCTEKTDHTNWKEESEDKESAGDHLQ